MGPHEASLDKPAAGGRSQRLRSCHTAAGHIKMGSRGYLQTIQGVRASPDMMAGDNVVTFIEKNTAILAGLVVDGLMNYRFYAADVSCPSK